MMGAGMVRDMRAAASLDGDFAAALTAFAAGTTRDQQRGMLDDLVKKWSETSSFAPGLLGTGGVSISYKMPPGITVLQYTTMINVLEKFNGSRFYGDNTGGPRPAGFAVQSATEPTTGNVTYSYVISPAAGQVALLQQAYDALKQSVYSALVVQTRLRQYTDQIGTSNATKDIAGCACTAWASVRFGYGFCRKSYLLRRTRLPASSSSSVGVTSSAAHKRNSTDRLGWFAATSSRAM